jgi:hypothetical protein
LSFVHRHWPSCQEHMGTGSGKWQAGFTQIFPMARPCVIWPHLNFAGALIKPLLLALVVSCSVLVARPTMARGHLMHSLKGVERTGAQGEPAISYGMNRLSLRNHRLKFETSGELPIVLEESVEYNSIE